MSHQTPRRLPRVLTIIVGALGAVMAVVGVSTYVFTAGQLSAQNITVAAITKDEPGSLAGKPVGGPFTALAQINAINEHMLAATGGKTYGELGNVATKDGATYSRDVPAASSTDGQEHKAGDALSKEDAATYSARATAQQGSFLQASLYVSVLAFGVSALIAGLGLVLVIIAVALWFSQSPRKASPVQQA